MSEKATLLEKTPPIAKAGEKSGQADAGGKSGQADAGGKSGQADAGGKSGQADAGGKSGQADTGGESGQADAGKESDQADAGEESDQAQAVGSETVAQEVEPQMTVFQAVTYGSFVLTFCLAGFVALVLFRKLAKLLEPRFIFGAKALGAGFVIVALHGVFATYLYTNFLYGESEAMPVVFSMALWIALGPCVGVVLGHLLTPGKRPERARLIVNTALYGIVFFLATLSLASGIKENAALIFSLLAMCLYIVPLARMLVDFHTAKARHSELRGIWNQLLIYGLVVFPALILLLGFVRLCGLDAGLTQFLINFLLFDFVLLSGIAMLGAADEMTEAATATSTDAATTQLNAKAQDDDTSSKAKPKSPATAEPDTAVSFEAEKQEDHSPDAAKQPSREKPQSEPVPPKKPGRSKSKDKPAAPNAPSRLKAPSRPKKRF